MIMINLTFTDDINSILDKNNCKFLCYKISESPYRINCNIVQKISDTVYNEIALFTAQSTYEVENKIRQLLS